MCVSEGGESGLGMKLTTQHAFCALFSLNYQLVYGKMEEADTLIEDLCRDKVRSIHVLVFTLSGSHLVGNIIFVSSTPLSSIADVLSTIL